MVYNSINVAYIYKAVTHVESWQQRTKNKASDTCQYCIIQIYSGITSGRVLNGELFYTKILEVNLFAFAYRLFHEDFSPINGVLPILETLCIFQPHVS